MFLSFNLSRIQKILLSGVLSLVLGGCPSGQPMGFVPTKTVPTPVVSELAVSVPQPVNPGDEIGISIRVDSVGGVALTYEWVLTEGKILEGEGTNAITYQAPIEPGTYSIRVKVTSADAIIQRSTFINVHEAGTSVSTLTNTVQLTSTLAQKPLTETITPSSTMPLVSTLTSTPIPQANTPTQTPVIPTDTPLPSTDTPILSTNTPISTPGLSRCEWLQANFPQSAEGIATQFGLPVERIRMIYEGCNEISNGFVIELGSEVQMTVPNDGCIDAPQDAGFSDAPEPDGFGGLRAYSGTVRAVVMTYRAWC